MSDKFVYASVAVLLGGYFLGEAITHQMFWAGVAIWLLALARISQGYDQIRQAEALRKEMANLTSQMKTVADLTEKMKSTVG